MSKSGKSAVLQNFNDDSDQHGSTAPDSVSQNNPLHLELLETRVLYSVDVIGITPLHLEVDDATSDSETLANLPVVLDDNQQTATAALEIIFIDQALAQGDILVADLKAQIASGRNAEIILLDPTEDGITAINKTLSQHNDVSAVHILTHGTSAGMQLGDTWVSHDTIGQYQEELSAWQNTLTDSADILLYGCNLAGSDSGLALLQTIATETQADVAASIDSTGHNILNANWTLEYTTGSIEHDIALTEEAQQAWENELAIELQAVDSDLSIHPNNATYTFDSDDLTENDILDFTGNDASDGPGTIQVISVTETTSGTLADNNDDTYTFTPPPSEGQASFDYLATNGDADILHHWRLNDNTDNQAIDEVGNQHGEIFGTNVVAGNSNEQDHLNFDAARTDAVVLDPIEYPDVFTLSFDFRLGDRFDGAIEYFFDQGDNLALAIDDLAIPGTLAIWVNDSNLFINSDQLVTVIRGIDANDTTHRISVPIGSLDDSWNNYTLTFDNSNPNNPTATVFINGVQLGSAIAGFGGLGGAGNDRVVYLGQNVIPDIGLASSLDDNDMRDLRIYEGIKTSDITTQDVVYDKATATIEFFEPNQKPVLQNLNNFGTYIENSSPVTIAPDVTVLDGNIGTDDYHDGATLSIGRSGGPNSDDVFEIKPQAIEDTSGNTIGTITGNNTSELLVSFNNFASPDLVNKALQSITYTNVSDSPDSSVTIEWIFDDGTSGTAGADTSDTGTSTIEIVQIPDIVVDITTPDNLDENQQNVPLLLTANIAHDLADPDTSTKATLQVANGTLSLTPGSTVNATGFNTSLLTLTGTTAEIETAIEALVYTPNTNFHGTDTLTINIDVLQAASLHDPIWRQSDGSQSILPDRTVINDSFRGEVLQLSGGDYLEASSTFGNPQEFTLSAWGNLRTQAHRAQSCLTSLTEPVFD